LAVDGPVADGPAAVTALLADLCATLAVSLEDCSREARPLTFFLGDGGYPPERGLPAEQEWCPAIVDRSGCLRLSPASTLIARVVNAGAGSVS
jgi:hypothetical protein